MLSTSSSPVGFQSAAKLRKPLQTNPLFAGKASNQKKSMMLHSLLLASAAPLAGAAPVSADVAVAPALNTTTPPVLPPWDMMPAEDVFERFNATPAAKQDESANEKRGIISKIFDQAKALKVLRKPPFKPTDVSIFNNAVYGAQPAPPASQPKSEGEIRSQLESTLKKRLGNDRAKQAMKLMDDAKLKQVAPDFRIRAAIVNLKGTAGEAAIDAYRNGPFTGARFAQMAPEKIGRSVTPNGQDAPEAQLNERYQHEDFRVLSATLAHETLHQDKKLSVAEEREAHAIASIIYGKMLKENPELVDQVTELTQRKNTELLARLNSRGPAGFLRIFEAKSNVYPDGNVALPNYGAAFQSVGDDSEGTVAESTPGNDAFKGMFRQLTGVPLPKPEFGPQSEKLMDRLQVEMSPVELVDLANVLKLQTT